MYYVKESTRTANICYGGIFSAQSEDSMQEISYQPVSVYFFFQVLLITSLAVISYNHTLPEN